MIYVLIVVFLNGYGPRPTVVMQEFASAETCNAAAVEIRSAWARSNDKSQLNGAVCVKK
jgi:hypothetical protein